MEILEAERDAGATGGGSLDELVADLPRILGADSGPVDRGGDAVSPSAQPPTIELHWPDGREELVADSTLANLPRSTTPSSRDASSACATSSASSPSSATSCTA